jgi:hypothetical protein
MIAHCPYMRVKKFDIDEPFKIIFCDYLNEGFTICGVVPHYGDNEEGAKDAQENCPLGHTLTEQEDMYDAYIKYLKQVIERL